MFSQLMRLVLIVCLFSLTACYHPLAKFRFSNWVNQNYPGQFRVLSTVSDWNAGNLDTQSYTVTFQSIDDSDLIFSLPWRTDQADGAMSMEKFEAEKARASYSLQLTREISALWRKEFPKTRLNLSAYPDESEEGGRETWRHHLIVYQYSSLTPSSEAAINSKTNTLLNQVRKILPNQKAYIKVHYFGKHLYPEKENPLLHPYFTKLVTTEYVSTHEEYSLKFFEIPKEFDPEDIRKNRQINALYPAFAKQAEHALFMEANATIPKSLNEYLLVLTPVAISLDNASLENWQVFGSVCKAILEEKNCFNDEIFQIHCNVNIHNPSCTRAQWEKIK
jgi:hypothetical protein